MPPTQLSPTTTFPNTQTSGLCGLLDVPQSPEEETSFAATSSQSLYSPFPYFYSNPMDTATLIGVRSFIDYSVLFSFSILQKLITFKIISFTIFFYSIHFTATAIDQPNANYQRCYLKLLFFVTVSHWTEQSI